jgi:hypothetical protein
MNNRHQSQEELADPFEAAARRCAIGSEFSWGAGLTPRKHRDKEPSEGGRYLARVEDRVNVRGLGLTPFGRHRVRRLVPSD